MTKQSTALAIPTQVALKVTTVKTGVYTTEAMRKYGSYTITERAAADLRDGLKLVQRRILWVMHEQGARSNKAPNKCARIVGDTIGKYHPHGDVAVYQSLVNMVHDRYPLVEGVGNFGDETDPAAAYRYTEARLTPFGEANLEEIMLSDMMPNFSGDGKEPLTVPGRVPLLLANGSSGIAVGINAAIPPHNLGELVDATCALVHNPNLSTKALLKRVHGPDHGYGVLLSSPDEVLAVYAAGRGSLQYRCEYELAKGTNGRNLFILKSIAPNFNLTKFLERMNDLKKDGLIDDCSNESGDENGGIHVEIVYKDVRVLEQRVLKAIHTTERYQFYTVIRDGAETLNEKTLRFCSFRDLLLEFIIFRREVETRRLKNDQKLARRALARAKALHTAVNKLDLVFAVLKRKGLDTRELLRKAMGKALGLDDEGAEFVLEMKTHQLARLNLADLVKNMDALRAQLVQIKKDLGDIDGVVVKRIAEMRKFADHRKMKVRVDGAAVAGKAKPGFVVARAAGAVTRCGDAIPDPGRGSYDYVVKTGERAICVTPDNTAVNFFTAYSGEAKLKGVVGLAADTDLFVAAVDESGRGVNFRTDVRTQKFDVLKAPKGKIVSATGIAKDDWLVLLDAKGHGTITPAQDCKVTRPGVLSYGLGDAHRKITKVLRLPPNAILVNGHLPLKMKKDGSFSYDPDVPVWVVGQQNYVHAGKTKGVKDRKDTNDDVKHGRATSIVCLG